MEKESESIIDKAFKKEIGIDINNAVSILNKGGITPEDLGDITNKLKRMMTDEVEIRKIPYEYRFLMLNVIFCTMFKTTAEFHKKFVNALEKTEETEETDEREKDGMIR
jgi:hypothetical protein